jgi:hypothetical protein
MLSHGAGGVGHIAVDVPEQVGLAQNRGVLVDGVWILSASTEAETPNGAVFVGIVLGRSVYANRASGRAQPTRCGIGSFALDQSSATRAIAAG